MPAIALSGCYVISLRPVGMHAAMRRAAAVYGARVLALSPWKLLWHDEATSGRALDAALACERVLFTSPTAVRAAAALRSLQARRGQRWLAVGSGTAGALHRAGIGDVLSPRRMDSEGLLALPELVDVHDTSAGLVTAPGGRGLIASALRQRGARVIRADVYTRSAVVPAARAVAALRALDAPAWLALSSGEALQHLQAALPVDARPALHRARVVAASERLARLAHALGFADTTIATSALPRDLMAAAAREASASMRGLLSGPSAIPPRG